MTFKAELRGLKLKLLDNPNLFTLDKNNINKFKTQLSFVKNNFPNDIITGSLALNLFGLITRGEIRDIDIIIEDAERFGPYWMSKYDLGELFPNRLGYKRFEFTRYIFWKSSYLVDLFKISGEENTMQLEFGKHIFKIHNPLEIINKKIQIIDSLENRQITNPLDDPYYFKIRKCKDDICQVFDYFRNQKNNFA